jgi:zinc transporter
MNATTAPKGLIHCLLLDGTGGARALSWAEVADWSAEQGCLWLHLNFEDEEAQNWLRRESGLNDIAYNGLVALFRRKKWI